MLLPVDSAPALAGVRNQTNEKLIAVRNTTVATIGYWPPRPTTMKRFRRAAPPILALVTAAVCVLPGGAASLPGAVPAPPSLTLVRQLRLGLEGGSVRSIEGGVVLATPSGYALFTTDTTHGIVDVSVTSQ